jgi:hypothetical protein
MTGSYRKNRRAIPHRLEKCGYVPVHNPTADDGLWKIKVERLMSSYPKGTPKPSPVVGKRQVVYAKKTLPIDMSQNVTVLGGLKSEMSSDIRYAAT